MSQDRIDKEEQKARIRAALDVLEKYTGADGKIDATKLTQRIADLEAKIKTQAKAITKYQQITDEQRKKIYELTNP